MLPVSILMALTFWVSSAFPDSGSDKVFAQALESFKRSELAQSRDAFSQLIIDHPNDPVLLYNLGLVEVRDNHPGRALAYWRKALYIKPGYGPAIDGFAFLAAKKFPSTNTISLLQKLYMRIPTAYFFAASLVLLLCAGAWSVKRISQNKLGANKSLAGAFSVLFLSALSGFFAIHSYLDLHAVSLATIMEASVAVHSSPNEASPSLFDFKEGDEVAVRRESADWLQVQKTATSVGWVKKNQLFIHSGPSSLN